MSADKTYVQGIAERVAKMGKPTLTYVDYCEEWSKCQYCQTPIKWMFYIDDLSVKGDNLTEFYVGSECIKHFSKYIGLEKWKLESVLSYFAKYQELVRELKTRPEAKIEIEKLEKEVWKAKEELRRRQAKAAEEHAAKIKPLLELVRAPGAPLLVSSWDKEFILSVSGQLAYGGKGLTEKQLKIVEDLLKKYDTSNLSPEYLAKIKEEMDAKREALEKDRDLINKLLDLRLSLFDRPFISSLSEWIAKGSALTENQRNAAQRVADKYHKQLGGDTQFVSPGVYELPTGEIFVVKFNREKSRVYAEKLVESSPRVTETGTVVDFDFQYSSGDIYKLKPEHLMPIERARELIIKYSRCIACGHTLKVAESVERGIGPVCVKFFKIANGTTSLNKEESPIHNHEVK